MLSYEFYPVLPYQNDDLTFLLRQEALVHNRTMRLTGEWIRPAQSYFELFNSKGFA